MLEQLHGRAVDVVDVGAAMGDTVAMLRGLCPEEVGTILCVEGEAEFARYLKRNVAGDDLTRIVVSLVSDGDTARSLVPAAVGTSTATGPEGAAARTLDDILSEHADREFALLKIDVDGYDGRVLAGSRSFLRSGRPHVFFEWAPTYYEACGSSWLQPFEVLSEDGYDRFAFFDKYGRFSHYQHGFDAETVRLHAELCLRSTVLVDWHYDVVALPRESTLSMVGLAEQDIAHRRKSARRR
jgi:FkbM family methyltransferase